MTNLIVCTYTAYNRLTFKSALEYSFKNRRLQTNRSSLPLIQHSMFQSESEQKKVIKLFWTTLKQTKKPQQTSEGCALCTCTQLYCRHGSNKFSVAAWNRDSFVPWDSSPKIQFYSTELNEIPATEKAAALLRLCFTGVETQPGKNNSI